MKISQNAHSVTIDLGDYVVRAGRLCASNSVTIDVWEDYDDHSSMTFGLGETTRHLGKVTARRHAEVDEEHGTYRDVRDDRAAYEARSAAYSAARAADRAEVAEVIERALPGLLATIDSIDSWADAETFEEVTGYDLGRK